MKTLFNILRTVFLLVGSIIGAGFITGAELVGFFGVENFILTIILSTVFLAVFLCLVFVVLKNGKTVEKLMCGKGFYRISTCVSSLIFTASMLAGIDALLNAVFNLGSFQFGSVLVIILISIFSKHGVGGLEKLNLFLMPLIIIVVNVLIFNGRSVGALEIKLPHFTGGLKAVLYVLMNVFICLPILSEASKNKSKKTLLTVAVLVALIIGFEAFIILSTIKNSAPNLSVDMPLYVALFKGGFSITFVVSMLSCAITSAFSAYYPLYTFSKEKSNGYGLCVSAVITLMVSKIGISGIVKYAYPLVGGLGGMLLVNCLIGIKNKSYADNNVRLEKLGGRICQKERKTK